MLMHIAKFDGTNWNPLGKRLNNDAEPMIEYQDNLLVGGVFSKAGDSAVNHLAIWNIHETEINDVNSNNSLTIYPNPAHDKVLVNFEGLRREGATICISDISGNKITKIPLSAHSSTTESSVGNLPDGIYWINIMKDNQTIATEKLIVIK